MWLQALRAKYDGVGKPFGRVEFDQLLGHCQVSPLYFTTGTCFSEDAQAITDFPAICFSEELIEAYPEAQVILTAREVDDWHKYGSLCTPTETQHIVSDK